MPGPVFLPQTILTARSVTNKPGANLTIVSYNASAVETYNATSSLVSFENRNILFYFKETL
jgi:hypothetical protein